MGQGPRIISLRTLMDAEKSWGNLNKPIITWERWIFLGFGLDRLLKGHHTSDYFSQTQWSILVFYSSAQLSPASRCYWDNFLSNHRSKSSLLTLYTMFYRFVHYRSSLRDLSAPIEGWGPVLFHSHNSLEIPAQIWSFY